MPSENTRNCQTVVSTIFTFESPEFQRACNMVYVSVSTISGATPNPTGNTNYIKFKSDYERMQYLLGQYGYAPKCQRE
jgi:hypothetical protein